MGKEDVCDGLTIQMYDLVMITANSVLRGSVFSTLQHWLVLDSGPSQFLEWDFPTKKNGAANVGMSFQRRNNLSEKSQSISSPLY